MRPDFNVIGDVYRFDWPVLEVTMELDRLMEGSRGGLGGELMVTTERAPSPGLLHRADFNISGPAARVSLANKLARRISDVDWEGLLEQLCFMTMERWRAGEPLIDLRTEDPSGRPRWLLKPYVELGGPTNLFADGGTGKSIFALAIGLSVASGQAVVGDSPPSRIGPILYLDWETDWFTHHERLRALAKGASIDLEHIAPIYYQHEAASLAEITSSLRRRVAELGIILVIVDSFGPAKGIEPEKADATIRAFNAARSLKAPTIFVDHVRKDEVPRKGKPKPFGSAYTYNLARVLWSMAKAEAGGITNIALVNQKSNNGQFLGRRGYALRFESEDESLVSLRFNKCDPRQVPEFAALLNSKERLVSLLEANNRPMSVEDIEMAFSAEDVEMSESAIRAALNRHRGRVFVKVGDEWGLIAK